MNVLLQLINIGWMSIITTTSLENLAQNLTYKGEASQNSMFSKRWAAEEAIDGHFEGEISSYTCSLTQPYVSKEAWWKLSLLQLSNVAYLLLFFKKSTVNRHTGFSVFVFNDSSYIPPSIGGNKVFTQNSSQCPTQMMNVTVNKLTKGMAIYNSKNPPLESTCEGYEPIFATIEICEVMVMGCHFQQYGESCMQCSQKSFNQECDAFDGSCIYGCSERFIEPPGCMICKRGYYGENCEGTCGKCKNGTACHSITGICSNGCEHNWGGSNCNECKIGFYGENCTESCGHCKSKRECHKVTGNCPKGCDIHWGGSQCQVCNDNLYGPKCQFNCGNCLKGTHCDKSTGVCPRGCKENWTGPKCDECEDYKYGPNCVFDCGHCVNGTMCSKINGACVEGCDSGWSGLICLKGIETQPTDGGISKTLSVIISIASTSFAIMILCIGIKMVNNRRKRKGRDNRDNLASVSVENPHIYDELTEISEIDHTYHEISSSIKMPDYQEIHIYDNTAIVDKR